MLHNGRSNIASLRVRRQAQWALYVKTYTLPLGTFVGCLFESRHTQQPTATQRTHTTTTTSLLSTSEDDGVNNTVATTIAVEDRCLSLRTLEMEFTRELCAEDVAFIRRCVWLESLTLDLSWVKDSGIPSLKTLFGGSCKKTQQQPSYFSSFNREGISFSLPPEDRGKMKKKNVTFDGSSLRHLSLSAVTDVYAHHQSPSQPLSHVGGSDSAAAVTSEETKEAFWHYFPPFLRSFELVGMNVNPSVSFARDWTVPLHKPVVPMDSFESLAHACPGLVEVSVVGCSALKSLHGLSWLASLESVAVACCPVSSVPVTTPPHQQNAPAAPTTSSSVKKTLHAEEEEEDQPHDDAKALQCCYVPSGLKKREVMLAQCPFITDLSFLHNSGGGGGTFFHHLTHISTIDCPLQSLEALACCPHLRALEIYECSQLQTLQGLHSDRRTLREYTSSLEVLSLHMQPHLATLEHMIPPLPEDAPSSSSTSRFLSEMQGCNPPPPKPLRRFSFPFMHTLTLDYCEHIQSLDCLARCEMPALVRFSASHVPIPALQPLLTATNIITIPFAVGGPEAEEGLLGETNINANTTSNTANSPSSSSADINDRGACRPSILKEIKIIGNTVIRSTEPLARLYREAVALCAQHGVKIVDAY